jgi:thymidine phosphorylase
MSRSDKWRIKQFNRNREVKDQVKTIEEINDHWKKESRLNEYTVSVSFTMEIKAKTAKDAEQIASNTWRNHNDYRNFKLQVEWPFGDSIAETDEEKEWEAEANYKEMCRDESFFAMSDAEDQTLNDIDNYWEPYDINNKS